MTRDDGQDPEADAPQVESDEAIAAAAETRVLDEEEAAERETRVVPDQAAETVAGDLGEASPEVGVGQTAIEYAAAATVLASEDDRTQLVQRDSASGQEAPGSGVGPASAETRLLDPSLVPESSSQDGLEDGAPRLPDTRVLDDPDKTAPPPAQPLDEPEGVREVPASPPPYRPSNPAPIDSDRGLVPGTVLFGEYEIVNVLGVGGMGEVYRARHRRLEEHRAIKVMHADLSQKKGASEFFYREAKALLAVRHPAVVHCHDLLSDDAGRVYLIMEMIEGIPLSKKMNDGPLSADDVAILGARVSHGLSAAHRKGVIHRDVSPDNIVLPNGRVQEAKIIDFGIAKLLEDGEGTIVDGFKGKLSYASPEQLGFFGGKIDGRSDFYSLGLVLVAAALGRPMSMGTTVVEAVDARRSFATLPDAIPVGLRSAIQPLLALDPDDRPKYVDRLFVVPGGPESGSDTGRISTGGVARRSDPTPAKGKRLGMIAGGAAAAALLIGGGLYLGLSRESAKAPAIESASPPNAAVADPARNESEREGGAPMPPLERPPVVDPEPPVVVVEKKPVEVAKKPVSPKPRRVTAGDRIKIIGLINNAKLALEENRLMSPANDNAYDRYRRVLELDPSEKRAKQGLREVSLRYVAMAERAAGDGNLERARLFVDRAKRADSSAPGIDALESQLPD